MTEVRVVLVTCANDEEAARIAGAVVTEALAACVNVIPAVRSFYVWEGELRRDNEVLLVIKTREAALENLQAKIQLLHGYSVPEFLVLPVTAGSSSYLDWVCQSVQ